MDCMNFNFVLRLAAASLLDMALVAFRLILTSEVSGLNGSQVN